MINTDELLRLIEEDNARDFWVTEEEDRVEFLEALDSLGYLWASGNRLLDLSLELNVLAFGSHSLLNLLSGYAQLTGQY